MSNQNYKEFTDEELVEKIQAGESGCMDEIFERYKRQVRNQARTLFLIGGDNDDLMQEGMLGLFKAVRDFRPEKEVSFENFARLCVSRQLYSAVRAADRQKHQPLNTYVELSDQNEAAGDVPGEKSPEEFVIDRENLNALQDRITKSLSSLERKVLNAYLEGEDYLEIAEHLGRPAKSIDNALQRIRRKVRQLSGAGEDS